MYTCAYIDTKKLSPSFLWVSKFDVKLGVAEHYFRNYRKHVSFQIFGSKLVIFDFDDRMVLFLKSIRCFENINFFVRKK